VRLLLDTTVLGWWLADPARLDAEERAAVADAANQIWYSAVSLWEMEVRRTLGRVRYDPQELVESLSAGGIDELPFVARHAVAAGKLMGEAGDPFDRMLAAQAICEGLHIVTHDKVFADHGALTFQGGSRAP